jgi:hypothetical protein
MCNIYFYQLNIWYVHHMSTFFVEMVHHIGLPLGTHVSPNHALLVGFDAPNKYR